MCNYNVKWISLAGKCAKKLHLSSDVANLFTRDEKETTQKERERVSFVIFVQVFLASHPCFQIRKIQLSAK